MRDLFGEIFSSILNNKLRTVLTGFAVAWGIFMLVCLLGAGNGLTNAISHNNGNFLPNSIEVFGGSSSLPYNGLKAGRRTRIMKSDAARTQTHFPEAVGMVAAQSRNFSVTMRFGNNLCTGYITGRGDAAMKIDKRNLEHGRMLSPLDERQGRKVVVIDTKAAAELLEGMHREASWLLGKNVEINGFSFKVVGLVSADESDMDKEVYAPFSTVNAIWNGGNDDLGSLLFTIHDLETKEANEEFEARYRRSFNAAHNAAPEDPSTIYIWNRYTQNMQMNSAFSIIRMALWIIGLLTLVSGIAGVSNIMLISVKERTREFGIRKAIGARPRSILSLIVAESVTVTLIFGYVGMLLGMVANKVMDKVMAANQVDIGFGKIQVLMNTSVDLGTAIGATLVLVVAGTIAGLVPAIRASHIPPIEALRAE